MINACKRGRHYHYRKKRVILKLNLDKCESKRINDFDDQNRCNYNWMRH